jgi:hypothetical protein
VASPSLKTFFVPSIARVHRSSAAAKIAAGDKRNIIPTGASAWTRPIGEYALTVLGAIDEGPPYAGPLTPIFIINFGNILQKVDIDAGIENVPTVCASTDTYLGSLVKLG